MYSRKMKIVAKRMLQFVMLAFVSCCAVAVYPQSMKNPVPAQRTFSSPQEGVDALIKAAETYDVAALMEIFGPEGKDLFSSADPVRDRNNAEAFVAKARQKNQLTADPKNAKRMLLSIGEEDWPVPVPLVNKKGRWRFDTPAGHDEIISRRIGANELDAIQICRGYVEAQHEYALVKHDGAEANQYAQRIISTPGKQDGLAWQNPDGTWGGPVGEGVAKALAQGYTDRSQPYHGYFFKILKGQGPDAPLGRLDFLVNGAMIGGFALVAAPAEYRVTGVKTFLVGYDGIVYERDLGPDTLNNFKTMELYDPDKTWQRTDENW